GDGGAVGTADPETAQRARRLREVVSGTVGAIQSRLDTLQAACLRAKLPHVDDWIARRRDLAARYTEGLQATTLVLPARDDHVFHLYVVRSRERDALRSRLAERGVETLVHYPFAVHQRPAWRALGHDRLRESERAAAEVVSLPLYPELTDAEAETVIEAVAR